VLSIVPLSAPLRRDSRSRIFSTARLSRCVAAPSLTLSSAAMSAIPRSWN
jgi:hypothetical protein